MAKDFFQDILPKDDGRQPKRPEIRETLTDDTEVEVPKASAPEPEQVPEKSIRNINVNRPRPMPPPPQRLPDRREVPPVGSGLPRRRRFVSSLWLWIGAAILLIVAAVLAIFLFRSTSVTIIPRAHTIVFDSTKTFTAYPSASAQSGNLAYTLQTFDVDESQPVTAQGSSHVERKAAGTVTIVNEYSIDPVKLVKTTRFQTPDGLVFRAPADISVPGMKGTAPGTVVVTLVADQAGDKYNIAATPRLTLPGLTGAMHEKVYARSTASFSGGFSGEEATVAPDAKNAAIAEMQGRIKDAVQTKLQSLATGDAGIFPSFVTISYQEMPSTPSENGKVNLNLRAHLLVPVLSSAQLNQRIASTVSADAENASITLVPKQGFGATLSSASTTALGTSPITFALVGTAQLVWTVDSNSIAQALAGKDESAFQTVVNGFPGVQEARARIEPFWRHTFPSDAAQIHIVVSEPKETIAP